MCAIYSRDAQHHANIDLHDVVLSSLYFHCVTVYITGDVVAQH